MKFAANNSHGVNAREPVRVFIRLEGRFMYQAPDGEVGHQEALELLAHQAVGRVGAGSRKSSLRRTPYRDATAPK
jgi:hypothetical protein